MNEVDKKAFEAALPEIFGPPISIIYEQYNTHIAAQAWQAALEYARQPAEPEAFNNDAAWELANKVRTDLDRKACPGVFMDLAMESINKHYTAQQAAVWPTDGLYPDITPPATQRDRWMFDQGRLCERREATPQPAPLVRLTDEEIIAVWEANSGRPVTMGKERIIQQGRALMDAMQAKTQPTPDVQTLIQAFQPLLHRVREMNDAGPIGQQYQSDALIEEIKRVDELLAKHGVTK